MDFSDLCASLGGIPFRRATGGLVHGRLQVSLERSENSTKSRRERGRAARPGIAERPVKNRSKVTNGKEVLPGTNGNTIWGRRYRDLCADIAIDLGGPDVLSEAQAQMVRRYASLSVQLEFMEAQLVEGKTIDDEKYARLTSSLVRVSSRIGMKRLRPSKDVTPRPTAATLKDYVAMRRAEEDEEAITDDDAADAVEVSPDA